MSNIDDNDTLDNLERSLTLGLDDKYDEVKQLIDMGKEKGYLLYDEVNDLLPSDVTSSDELDDMFSIFRSQGIEVVDGEPKAAGAEKIGFDKEAWRRRRIGLDAGRPGQDQRSCSALPEGNGYCSAADSRRRSRNREAN